MLATYAHTSTSSIQYVINTLACGAFNGYCFISVGIAFTLIGSYHVILTSIL